MEPENTMSTSSITGNDHRTTNWWLVAGILFTIILDIVVVGYGYLAYHYVHTVDGVPAIVSVLVSILSGVMCIVILGVAIGIIIRLVSMITDKQETGTEE